MTENVSDHQERSRFELTEDGEVAGFIQYRRSGNGLTLVHTETGPRFRGRGIGGRLVAAVPGQARAQGAAVLPYCPFVRSWLADHPGYTDLVPEARRPEFGLTVS